MKLIQKLFHNPILSKELQWRMRVKKTPWLIALYLVIVAGIVFTVLSLQDLNRMATFDSGANIWVYTGLSFLNLLMLAFIVPGITAGLISGERERQTLDVLLTTNLSSSQIIYSKWIASLSFVLMLLLLSSPLYVIVYLYGGISPAHIWQSILHLMVTVLFLGSLGIFYSTWIKRTGIATVLTYASVAFIGIGLPLIYILMWQFPYFQVLNGQHWIFNALLSLHPASSLAYVISGDFGLFSNGNHSWHFYWIYIGFYTVLSAILMFWSTYLLSPIRFRRLGFSKKVK
ncbi:ABC transporter permease subunit [Hazenella sp. IB182357]|uniref:ABC transporter permease subunit n=1 Tax=Polycladospora coralii TaxID=2771432 RepID=A0A926RTC8_9BACL|nr:ABC transporter permease subunit [Polycladospora coralii]MBD1372660.1 ABC transporter permease subunit [Polycladospora coralii]